MKKLKVVYFGTPDFAASFLEKMIHDSDLPIEICLVVTQPDKPVGRKQVMTPTFVKAAASKFSLPTYDRSIKNLKDELATIKPDLALLYAYGAIIPSDLIELFPVGFWNIHPSLLPMYRNVAPMAFPLILGDTETGVTLIQLDEKLDHGPIIAQQRVQIDHDATRSDLESKLSDVAFSLFKEQLSIYSKAGVKPELTVQDHTKATFTRKMKKDDGFIPLDTLKKALLNEPLLDEEIPRIITEFQQKYPHISRKQDSAPLIFNLFRGLYPWPGIWTLVQISGEEKRLKITDMKFENERVSITKVQLEGKNEVDFKIFNDSYQIFDSKT